MGRRSIPIVAPAQADRHIPSLLVLLLTAGSSWLFGCASWYSADADREVGAALQKYQKRVLGDRDTWIKRPASAPARPDAPDGEDGGTSGEPAGESVTSDAESAASRPARDLDLTSSLGQAFQASRRMKTERETLFQSGLGLTLARYTFGPILDSTISYIWNYAEGAPNTHALQFPASVRQLLPLGGSVSATANVDATRVRSPEPAVDNDFRWSSNAQVSYQQPLLRGAGYEASHEPLTRAQRGLVYAVRRFELFRQDFSIEVAEAYYQLVSQRKRLDNDEQNYKDAVQDRNKADALRSLDRNKPDDVFQARRREIESENALIASRTDYRLRVDSFKILLGLPTSESVTLAVDDPPFEAVRIDAKSAVQCALHNRLDLHTQRDQVEDTRRGLRIAENGLLPDLSVTGTYGTRSAGGTADLTPNVRSGSAGISLELPVDRKAERNALRSAEISVDQAVRGLQQREDEIERDVLSALRQLDQLEKQIQLQREQIDFETRAVAVIQTRIEAGDAQQRDLADARQGLTNAQNRLIDFLVSHFIARLRLQRDMGVLFVDSTGAWQT